MSDALEETAAGSTSTTPGPLAPGALLGKYKLERMLGAGAMGIVWAARDPDLDRIVALKVLRYEDAAPALRTRLQREARAMARLKHPNVLTVYEAASDGRRDFIAMELVDGEALDAWLASKPPRDAVWDALLAAGRGLAAAHAGGLVHRDFKPANVLRGRDGRVLVTDFGLARGLGEERLATERTLPAMPSALDATLDATPSHTDSVLDSPLTQTGAVLGTPAYMAPEQFRGAASDARTDQFAFCITAWQMLGGERPFRGGSLDELHRAASAGVAGVKSKLRRGVRAVLARGLAADPARRWPDMDALLAALERARHARGRLVRRAGIVVALAAAGVLAWKLSRGDAAASLCDVGPDAELAKAWSPERRTRFFAHFGQSPGTDIIANALDGFAAAWLADYRDACAAPRSTRAIARIGCLLGQRDEVAALSTLFPAVRLDHIDNIEIGGVLPMPRACDGESPVAPPTLPADPERRRRIQTLRQQIMSERFGDPRKALLAMPALVDQARATGWDPLVAEAEESWAISAEIVGDWVPARDHYERANELARRGHHYRLEAETWIGLLDAELQVAKDPSDPKRFDDLIAHAREAIQLAGDDPAIAAKLLYFEGVYASSRDRLDDAIALADRARRDAFTAGSFPHGVRLAAWQAEYLARRSRPGDLDDAWRLLTEAHQLVDAKRLVLPRLGGLVRVSWQVARMRGDLATAHAWADRGGAPQPPARAVQLRGRVVDAAGNGVAGARVVAWQGALHGDAARVFARPDFAGDVATTDARGEFALRGVPDGGIVAELGDRRSPPRAIGDAPLVLALAPTRTVTGTVTSDDDVIAGVVAIARYDLGAASWELVAPVDPTAPHAYRLAGLPSGAATLRLDDALDRTYAERTFDRGPVRDGASAAWPVGPTIDAIVRGGTPTPPTVWVLRGRVAAKTRAEVEAAARRGGDVVVHPAFEIGIEDQTVAGIAKYRHGDRHGQLPNIAPGDVTVCAADAAPSSPATCAPIAVRGDGRVVRDGRGYYPAIVVELSL